MTRIINLISRVYWVLGLLLAPVVLLLAFLHVFFNVLPKYSITVFNFTSAFVYKSENQDFLKELNSMPLHLGFIAFIIILFTNSKIFRNIAFLFFNKNSLSYLDKKRRVFSTIKYIGVTFFFSLISELCLHYIPSSESSSNLIWILMSYLLPSFGSSIDLLFALVLYFYIKDQEELEKLKNESELVI